MATDFRMIQVWPNPWLPREYRFTPDSVRTYEDEYGRTVHEFTVSRRSGPEVLGAFLDEYGASGMFVHPDMPELWRYVRDEMDAGPRYMGPGLDELMEGKA
ncbi:hypothetical protein SEA_SCHMIDT_62 [Gordonia phage Schmidt]|uniref:Uncharacterized protein n=1 Tax=Gordonia phage Schmidt TaxID=2301697 RepID=A0A385E2V9_9CAUD|nr:hypothetical protein KDJ59_gp62 [Gordonia phage Schmidt]AXQ65182.1 hypothetical protein SEA_SCHMIDT_62 [Gordonia phage Schmidt]